MISSQTTDRRPNPIYLGIDPGKSGSIVAICQVSSFAPERIIYLQRLDAGPSTVILTFWDFLRFQAGLSSQQPAQVFAFLEKVCAQPRSEPDGQKAKMGAATSFKFGQSFGFLQGILWAAKEAQLVTSITEVTPRKWTNYLGLSRKPGETTTKWKNRHKDAAAALPYAGPRITHYCADAILIAHYGRRQVVESIPKS